jgi:SAM-dependent methyltransferase
MEHPQPNPRFARTYLRLSPRMEARGQAGHRRRLLAGLRGRVIEVGPGGGGTFPYYPAEVTEVVAVEPEPTLREHAERQARSAPVPVRVVAGHAGRLPGDRYDAAVVSLVLCSVDDQAAALAELHRVVRPGGELRFYEHVRSRNRLVARLEDLVTPLYTRFAGGCRPNRDTLAQIAAAGFVVEAYERFGFSGVAHVLGRAVRF